MKPPFQAGLAAACVLFTGAAAAFACSLYALGCWLAFGCVSIVTLGLTASMRADRPETVQAIRDAAESQRAALEAVTARLTSIENKAQFLTASFTSAFPSRQAGAPMRSPVRPPMGR